MTPLNESILSLLAFCDDNPPRPICFEFSKPIMSIGNLADPVISDDKNYPDNKVHGANMGPPGSCLPQMGPMSAP